MIVTRLAGRVNVAVQNPIRLDRHSEPQPDVVVARRRPSSYTGEQVLERDDTIAATAVAGLRVPVADVFGA